MSFTPLVIFVIVVLFLNTKFINAYTTEFKRSYSYSGYDILVYSLPGIHILQKNNNDSNTCSRMDYENGSHKQCGPYKIKIYSKTNAIGLPIEFNGKVLMSQNNDFEFIADTFYSGNISTTKNVKYYPSSWIIDSKYDFVNSGWTIRNAAGGMLYFDQSSSFDISWTPRETVKGCFSITYRLESSDTQTTPSFVIRENDSNNPIVSLTLPAADGGTTMILKTDDLFLKNKEYHFVISHSYESHWRRFGIKRVAHCNENGDEYEISSEGKNNLFKVWNINNEEGQIFNPITKPVQTYEECEPNYYGPNCSESCSSMFTTFCRGLLFCTMSNECSCTSGLTGRFCDEECSPGTYGRDCKKKCSENCISCNTYTGNCEGNCKTNFIPPDCTERYPWLINPPQLVSSDHHSVQLNISFESENIGGSKKNNISFYQIIYKQSSNKSEFQYADPKEIGDSTFAMERIENLLLGTEYYFGAIVVTEDGNFNEEDVNIVNYTTQCQVPMNIDYGIKLSKGAEYINVTWITPNTNITYECEINEYMLKLLYNDTYEVVYTKTLNYLFNNLMPAHTYAVQVTAMTIQGPAEPSNIFYETLNVQGYIGIKNIASKLLDTDTIVHLTWELNEAYKNASISYLVKYKINRHYSCSFNTINNNWTTTVVNNKTEHDILNLIPNTQYIIQVHPITEGYTYGNNKNVIFVKTASSTPTIAPTLDTSQPIFVTNDTTLIKWHVDNTKCDRLNGFPTGFHLILKNLKDSSQIVQETKDASIKFTNLVPYTEYELQVFIKTKKGFNINYMLSVPFKTKGKFLPAVEDLTVYKKNYKSKQIGLRWSYLNDCEVNGFIIQVSSISQKSNNIKQMTTAPIKCKAWPTLYCATVEDLKPNTEYTIKLLAKSIDYPNGGLPSSVNFNTIDGAPNEPENLRTTQIGAKNITLEWDIPYILNGVLNSFIINAEEVSSVDGDSCCSSLPVMEVPVTEEKPNYSYSINDMKPGSTYTIGVLAKTSTYNYGQAKRIIVTTTVDTSDTTPKSVDDEILIRNT